MGKTETQNTRGTGLLKEAACFVMPQLDQQEKGVRRVTCIIK